ncbi:hypothetical protein CCACVL1_21520 [Corchorus capsularis]|uniref:Uncharacterized protein n=1 Tax=Corchorus capsularis TaxID=210143 RepID=A0A1R3H569_COCAP|nr:hypothetical protein CCACVL1_21520 [Corchorus capsularis]
MTSKSVGYTLKPRRKFFPSRDPSHVTALGPAEHSSSGKPHLCHRHSSPAVKLPCFGLFKSYSLAED